VGWEGDDVIIIYFFRGGSQVRWGVPHVCWEMKTLWRLTACFWVGRGWELRRGAAELLLSLHFCIPFIGLFLKKGCAFYPPPCSLPPPSVHPSPHLCACVWVYLCVGPSINRGRR
jgi:hypothetical protein